MCGLHNYIHTLPDIAGFMTGKPFDRKKFDINDVISERSLTKIWVTNIEKLPESVLFKFFIDNFKIVINYNIITMNIVR